ncbi:glycosyltransferase family 4 protein [Euzebya sp.]|uniref:glycosyltransferase family 4 protein n=1 Tax=Euzebya sp. TaxID=1971409 RepID=UPI003516E1E0
MSTRELRPLLDDPDDDAPPGNGGYPVTLLVAELVRAGHDVRVWTLDPSVRRRHDVRGEGLAVTYLPQRTSGRGRDAYAAERRWLADALAGARVDVWNPHWSYEYALAAQAHRGRGGAADDPLVLTVHDWAPAVLRYQPDPYRVVRLGMYARVHLRRPAMTTPSPYLAAKLRRTGLGRAHVVPNGVAADAIADRPRTRGSGAALLGIAMGFSRRKNTTSLLRAHGRLRAAGVPSRLVLVGADHEPGGVAQAWARARDLDEDVTFAGVLPYDRVLDALASCDVFVHPAREESFGMVLAEAMAQGTPVVAGARSGAVPWVLDDGRAGVLADVDDPGAIALAVQGLLSDRRRWEQLSAAGLAHVRRRFAMPVVAEGYLAAYRRAAGS